MIFVMYTIQLILQLCTDSNFSLSHFLDLDLSDLYNYCLDPTHSSVYGFKPKPKSIYSELFKNKWCVNCLHYCFFPNFDKWCHLYYTVLLHLNSDCSYYTTTTQHVTSFASICLFPFLWAQVSLFFLVVIIYSSMR